MLYIVVKTSSQYSFKASNILVTFDAIIFFSAQQVPFQGLMITYFINLADNCQIGLSLHHDIISNLA